MEEGKDIIEVPESAIQVLPKSPVEMCVDLLKAGVDPEMISKMMDLQDRHEAKQAEMAFVKAMVKAQKGMPVIYEGRTNKAANNSSYAAYKDIVRDAKPIYTGAGLSVSFYEEDLEKQDYVRFCADVYHEEGHCKKYHSDLPIDDKGPKGAPVKTKIHGIKSAMSYGRGILLCNIFNIPTSADVDDDGNGAGNIELITEEQVITLEEHLKAIKGDLKEFCKWANVQSVDQIQAQYYDQCLNALKVKGKE